MTVSDHAGHVPRFPEAGGGQIEPSGSSSGLTRRSIVHAAAATVAMTLAESRGRASRASPGWQPINPDGVGLLNLPALIGDRPVRAALDTASSRTVVESGLADAVGLERLRDASATGLAGPISGTLVRIPRLRVAGLMLVDIDAQSYDLSALANAGEVQIVVGQDVLSRCGVDLQFSRSRFRLTDGADDLAGTTVLGLTRSPRRLPLLSAVIEGGAASSAILDLGSDVVCSVSRRYAEERRLLKDRPVSSALTAGAEGAAESLVVTARSIELGPYKLRGVPVCVIDDWQRSSPVDLGWPFFRAFDMLLDLGRNRLGLRTDEARLATPFPKDRAGLAASRGVDRYVVRHVARGSPAERAGLRDGDEVIAIDRRRVDDDWPRRGERQGLRPVGTHLLLDLADGRRLELILANYF
jgi:hypothetical protein